MQVTSLAEHSDLLWYLVTILSALLFSICFWLIRTIWKKFEDMNSRVNTVEAGSIELHGDIKADILETRNQVLQKL